eukprot:CAMPEP_0170470192 /NCGR_PEP_ID=MMETSP0123-20130129/12729_1 /TAXON_ID=182087 /ORGANISM="Favella ehrenbergii, Strain Fehren 1" /LENGTH=110 /DNA_ID=CAMNT_0010737229 /DNA_START=851 /DNA_END=1183 /DNA_ORIENTATION=+
MTEDLANIVRSTGLITQTRRNILLIRYRKATGNDLKSHKLQQLLDKVFCERLQRLTLDQFAEKICSQKMSLGLPKPGAMIMGSSQQHRPGGNRRPSKIEDSDDELPDFNP